MANPIVDYSVSPVTGTSPLTVNVTLNSVIIEGFDLQPISIAHFGALDENYMLNGFQISHFGHYIALPVISYVWDFGNGDTFFGEQPPSHTYNTPGNYILRLIIVVDGIAYQYPTTITARANINVLAGVGQNPDRVSYTYGNDETQGVGWSSNSGDSHLWSDTYGSIFSIFNEDGDHEQLIYDSIEGLPYIYNTRKVNPNSLIRESWKGRENPLDDNSGIEIKTRVRLQEYKGSHESYFQQMSDINLFYQPMRRENQNAIGYDSKGLRSAFEVDLELYADEKLEKVAHAHDVPIDRELFFDRKVKGHVLQIAFETLASEYRFTRSEVYLTNYDHAVWPSQPQMTEKTYQFNVENLLRSWLTRSENLLVDSNGLKYGTTDDYLPTGGADGYGNSAFTIINPSNLLYTFSGFLNGAIYHITMWCSNQNGPTFPQVVQPTVTVVGSVEKSIDPDNPGAATRIWYFLNIIADISNPISDIEFLNGDSYFDVRFFELNNTVNDSETLNYMFNDIDENKGNAICPSWF